MESTNHLVATPSELVFEGVKISCPVQEGHKMIPVRTACEILDADFQNQDTWLKSHPFFGQLYKIIESTGADGKMREMRCLSIFDLYAWVASISLRNRNEQSVERQYHFLAWIREKMIGAYKSAETYVKEAEYERKLIELKGKTEEEIQAHLNIIADLKKKTKEIEKTIDEIRYNRITGQIALSFPDNA